MTHLSETDPKSEGLKVAGWYNKRRGNAAPADPVAALREGYGSDSGDEAPAAPTAPAAPARPAQRTLADARRELAERAVASAPPPSARPAAKPAPARTGGGGEVPSGARLAAGALNIVRKR